MLDRVLDDVSGNGPLSARQIETDEVRSRVDWGWNWSEAKYVLEYLFDSGVVGVARRNSAFERLYDLNERVLPGSVLGLPDPSDDESYDTLVARSAQALGVADAKALVDYFYLPGPEGAAAIARLAERAADVVLKEGRNRQIRRMAELVELRVVDLMRVRVGPLKLGDLPEGKWRPLSAEERAALITASKG